MEPVLGLLDLILLFVYMFGFLAAAAVAVLLYCVFFGEGYKK